MDPLLVGGLGAIFASIALAAVCGLVGGRDRAVARSLQALAAAGAPGSDLRRRDLSRPFVDRVLGPLLHRFVAVGRWTTSQERMTRIRRRLDLAGNPAGWDPDRVLGAEALCGLVGLCLGLIVPALLGAGPLPTVVISPVVAAGAWFVPDLWLYQIGYQRSERIRRELPDALDLLTISMEAGLAFDAALAHVARKSTGPLAEEFFRVLQEMHIGIGRVGALRALADRTDVDELTSFIAAMVQADSLGVAISAVLRVQSREMRVKRSQRAEELAQKIPVKILFPLIFCILPCLFIVVIGPAAITILQNFSGGR